MNSSTSLVKNLFKNFLKINANKFECYATAPATPAVGAVTKGAGGLGGKLGGSKKKGELAKKVELKVETDSNKLAKYCCGLNILKTGGQEVVLKPTSEYPEWLWELKIDGKGPSLDEMSPDTLEYWFRRRRIGLRHKNKLSRKQYPQPFIPKSVTSMRLA